MKHISLYRVCHPDSRVTDGCVICIGSRKTFPSHHGHTLWAAMGAKSWNDVVPDSWNYSCMQAFNYSAVPCISFLRCAVAHAALKPRLDKTKGGNTGQVSSTSTAGSPLTRPTFGHYNCT